MRRKFKQFCIIISVTSFWLLVNGDCFAADIAAHSGYAVGSLAGSFHATATGAASYGIPIAVPPGTADLAPLLTVTYNSQQANGLLGMGFSLQGLTAIKRCASNLAQNGFIHGVDYSDKDRFCLNGEQLIAIKGVYGNDGTLYRTYLMNNTKIISYGRQGNGPARFKVWTKDGQIAEYGFTNDAQIYAEGKATIATWALNKISDQAENYLLIRYGKDDVNGYYPSEIDYTGNDAAKVSPYNVVKFFYIDRPDKIDVYQVGSRTRIVKLLSEIQVFADGRLAYAYKFSYQQSLNTGRSLLRDVQQCAGNGSCMPPTNFHWQETVNPHWVEVPNYALPVNIISEGVNNGVRFVDLNGDGILDVLYKRDGIGSGAWINNGNIWVKNDRYIFPGDGSDGFNDRRAGRDKGARFLDFAGNGLEGIIQSYHWDLDHVALGGGYKDFHEAWLNTPNGWQKAANYQPPCTIVATGESSTNGDDNGVRFVDLNGDGLPDIIEKRDKRGDTNGAWLNTGNGWRWASQFLFPDESGITDEKFGRDKGVRFLDLNGDGLVDIVISYTWQDPDFKSYRAAYLNTGNGWQAAPNFNLPATISSTGRDAGVRFIDLNGDGLLDIIQGDGGARHAWINTGAGWIDAPNFAPPFDIAIDGKDQGIIFIDLNGDGVLDVIQNNGAGKISAWINTGVSWREAPNYFPPDMTVHLEEDAGFRVIDLNGSGIPGILRADTSGEWPHKAWVNSLMKPDLLISVRDGLGAELKLTYKPLTDKTIYQRDFNAKFPDVDFQSPFYVIAETASMVLSNDIKTQNNNNGLHITKYNYRGAKIHKQGFGFLGFRQIITTDQSTGVSIVNTYGQEVMAHNVGQVLKSETRLAGGNLIAKTENIWNLKNFGDGSLGNSYYAPYTEKVITNSYDLNGNWLSRKTTAIHIDDFLNPIKTIIYAEDKTGLYTTITDNVYANDRDKWLIGSLTKSTITASAPGAESISRTSCYNYDARGMLWQSITEPGSDEYQVVTEYARDQFGNVSKTTISGANFSERAAENIYDHEGRFIIQKINALGHAIKQSFDSRFGKPIAETDVNGLTTYFQYDEFGRLVLRKYPDGTKTDLVYEWNSGGPSGAIYKIISLHTESPRETIYYDALNRQLATTTQGLDGRVIWRTTNYDDLGRVTRTSLPYFVGDKANYTKLAYDVLGRITKTIHADNAFTSVVYDGLATRVTNVLGQIATKFINVRGDLLQVTDNLGQKLFYQYDALSNVTKVIDSAGNVTLMDYDGRGRRIAIKDPDKGLWTYKYDALGQLIAETDALQQTTTFKYDKLGRMTMRTDRAGTSTWEYDTEANGIGKITAVNGITSPTGQAANAQELVRALGDGLMNYKRAYRYDKFGRLAQTILTISDQKYLSTTKYDVNGHLISETYPSGLEVKNTYNALGFLVKIENAKSGNLIWQVNSLDAVGHVTSELIGNGLVSNYQYDGKNNFLLNIETEHAISHNQKQNLNYSYDALGNIKSRKDVINNISENFYYDGLNRLLKAELQGSKAIDWHYDAIGNITYKSDVGNYIYGERGAGPHALTSVVGEGKPAKFFYNANGDQTSANIDGVARTLSYTTYSKPYVVTNDKGTTNFYYNADRERFERIDKFASGKTVTTLYMGNFELVITRDSDQYRAERKHYLGPNTLYAESADGEQTYTLLHDSLGSITDILDAEANVIAHFYYTPFGEQKQVKGDFLNYPYTHHGFTGHEEIEMTKLIHMRGRIYDPVFGRFLSADPFVQNPDDQQTLNRYSYCINNPLTFTDPSGYNFFNDALSDIGNLVHEVGIGVGKLLQNEQFDLVLQVAVGAWMPSVLPIVSAVITGANGGNFFAMIRSAGLSFGQIETWNLVRNVTGNMGKAASWSGLVSKGESVLIHGAVGGGLSKMTGGNFQDGFVSSALADALSGTTTSVGKGLSTNAAIMGRSAAAGFIGGTIAALSHGNFYNGAETAALSEMCGDRTAFFNQRHGQKFNDAKSLATMMQPNAVTFGERALRAVPGHFTIIDWYLHLLHIDLAHMEVFYTDADGVLRHRGFNGGGTGIHADENYRAIDLSNYSFGLISRNVQVTESVLMVPSFSNPASYNLLFHNCQYYGHAILQRLHLGQEAF